jgi:hypothetical protein
MMIQVIIKASLQYKAKISLPKVRLPKFSHDAQDKSPRASEGALIIY